MLYIAYLDEFGHVGPFISRDDARHKTSPVFGLAGLVIPYTHVRSFTTWFFQLKCHLLKFELTKSGTHPAKWEKKGAALYTTANVTKYRELRVATNRMFNQISKIGGYGIYIGIEKTFPPNKHNTGSLYRGILRESLKRLDQFAIGKNAQFMVILDQSDDALRREIVASSGISMFGDEKRKRLIEPPIQAESHLYQTLQCADWICGLVGRLACYQTMPLQYPDFEWAEKYFGDRLRQIAPFSGIRKQ